MDESDIESDFEGFTAEEIGIIDAERPDNIAEASDIDISDWDPQSSDEENEISAPPVWTDEIRDINIDDFTPLNVGPNHLLAENAKVMDFFNLFFTKQMSVDMAMHYADKWVCTTEDCHQTRPTLEANHGRWIGNRSFYSHEYFYGNRPTAIIQSLLE